VSSTPAQDFVATVLVWDDTLEIACRQRNLSFIHVDEGDFVADVANAWRGQIGYNIIQEVTLFIAEKYQLLLKVKPSVLWTQSFECNVLTRVYEATDFACEVAIIENGEKNLRTSTDHTCSIRFTEHWSNAYAEIVGVMCHHLSEYKFITQQSSRDDKPFW